MNLRIIIIIMAFLGSGLNSVGQELEKHRWEDRLVLVYSAEKDSEMLRQQLNELSSDLDGFKDRRLVVYSVSGNHYRKGFGKSEWREKNASFDDFFQERKDFEVLLLGLDGRVKLRQEQLLTREKLYATIDAMPMRRNEMQNREEAGSLSK